MKFDVLTESDRNKTKLLLIMEAIAQIDMFIADVNYQKYINDNMLKSALIFNVMKIGFISKRLSINVIAKYNDIPWDNCFQIAHKLHTQYYKVDYDYLWDFVNNEILKLSNPINKILEEEFNN